MKQSKTVIKILSVLLAFCFILGTAADRSVMYAVAVEYNDEYNRLSNSEKQAYLEQKLKEVNQKLDSLSKQSKETEEYISALDEKINYLQKQLKLSRERIESSKDKIQELKSQYSKNEEEIAQLKLDIAQLEEDEKKLTAQFDESYEQYSQRARALYISGETSTLSALVSSGDISTLFTRLEMISRIAKADQALLESLIEEGQELEETKTALVEKQDNLTVTQTKLKETQADLTNTVSSLELQQTEFDEKETAYKAQRDESDQLLVKLQAQTGAYSESRNQSQEELEAVNREIEQAAEEFRKKMEEQEKLTATTTTKKATTTKKPTTQKPSSTNNNESSSTVKTTTTRKTTTKKTTTASNKLQFTYPVPSQKTITTAYGSAGYAGHTGVDYACAKNSKVVAAESGYVIISKDITTPPYDGARGIGGYYSYGRYIVIAHDKKNSSGNYVYTLYAHNTTRVVSEGDYVKKGQLIAYSGETGNTYGPHLHFEVRTPSASYDDCVNPSLYLP